MALPFMIPSDEDVEENYRRLERLLRDLYHVLHALLNGGAPISLQHRHPHNQQPPPPPPPASGPAMTVPRAQSGVRRAALPTLFTPPIVPQLPRTPISSLPNLVTRLQKTSGTPLAKSSPLNTASPTYWSRLGRELRDIADNFQATTTPRRISLQLEMESGDISFVTPQQSVM